MEFWTGTEASLRSSPLTLRRTGVVSAAVQAPAAPLRTTPLPGGAPAPVAPAAVPTGAAPAAPAPAVQPLSLTWHGPREGKVGDKLVLMLDAQSGAPLGTLNAQVEFDAAALKVVSVAEGTYFRQQSLPSRLRHDIDNPGGQLKLEIATDDRQGARGSGSVAAVTFEVLAPAAKTEVKVSGLAPVAAGGESLPYLDARPHVLSLQP